MVRVFLILIPYNFDLFKGVFWFQVQNFSFRRKPRYNCMTPSLFTMLRLQNPLPYSLEYTKDQRNRWGVSRKQFLSIFRLATQLTYPAMEFIYQPSYPYGKLTKISIRNQHFTYSKYLGTNNGHKRQVSIKKTSFRFLRVTPHDL